MRAKELLIAVLTALGMTCVPCAAVCQAGEAPRPNVVLFLVDDMGWMDSPVYGSRYYETPAMERLADQAMRFTSAYALPLCSPTRASILTGQYSARHGITSATGHQPPQPAGFRFLPDTAPPNRAVVQPISKNYLDPAQITLGSVLQDAGYRTAHLGKWHLGLTPEYRPDRYGFDVTFHCAPDPGPPSYFSPYGVVGEGAPGGRDRRRVGNITDGPAGEYITDRLTDEALRFIEANRDRPFFLNLWHYGVHGPWGHKESYTREFADKKDPRGMQGNPVMASMLRSIDESLARVLDKLDELELAENTILIFYSDNGGNIHSRTESDTRAEQAFGNPNHPQHESVQSYRKWAGYLPPTDNSPLSGGKGDLREGGCRVPLMVRWPGRIAPASTSDEVVGPIDLYPTILDLLQIALPEAQVVDGVSIAPVLTGRGTLQREAYFTFFPHRLRTPPGVWVRSGPWKLIRWFETNDGFPDEYELYNLRDDIGETSNLADAHPARVRALSALIDRHLAETNALLPKPNPNYRPRTR